METGSILSVLQNGTTPLPKSKSSRFSRAVQSLGWRQKFLNKDFYEFQLENSPILQVQQVLDGENTGIGTGGLVWPAAHILSKYLELTYPNLAGLRVCDVGSGTGMVGIVAALLGAKESVLTDVECIMFLMERNREWACEQFPSVKDRILLQTYEWNESAEHLQPPFDIVLVSDCVLPKLYPIEPLIEATARLLGPNSVALFSYEHRPYPLFDPRHEFDRLASKHGLVRRNVPLSEHHPIYCCDDIEIWEVRRADFVPRSDSKSLEKGIAEADSETSQSRKEASSCAQVVPLLQALSWGNNPTVDYFIEGMHIQIAQESSGAIGCVIWPSSVVCARFLLGPKCEELFGGNLDKSQRPIAIDLGSGCGLTSMALLLRGYHVISCEISHVIPLLRRNLESFVRSCVDAGKENIGVFDIVELTWTDFDPRTGGNDSYQRFAAMLSSYSSAASHPVRLIVCSDCLYNCAWTVPFMELLLEILTQFGSDSTNIIITNELRTAFDEFVYLWRSRTGGCLNNLSNIDLESSELEVFRGSFSTDNDPTRPVAMIILRNNAT